MTFQNDSLILGKTENISHKKVSPGHLLHKLFHCMHDKGYYKYLPIPNINSSLPNPQADFEHTLLIKKTQERYVEQRLLCYPYEV